MLPEDPAKLAHDVKMTSYERRCDVMTSHRRSYDVILAPNAHWVNISGRTVLNNIDSTTETSLERNLADAQC